MRVNATLNTGTRHGIGANRQVPTLQTGRLARPSGFLGAADDDGWRYDDEVTTDTIVYFK